MGKQGGTFCVVIYISDKDSIDGYRTCIKNHPDRGQYLQARVDRNGLKNLTTMLRKKKIKYRYYESRWERSNDYRKQFFASYPGPYRCRYCDRWLARRYMVIDHIVPVARVKTNTNARMLLYMRGISNVNDVRNLAPSCQKCNERKGDRIGLWWLRGVLGKYRVYWVLRKAIIALALIALAAVVLNKFLCFI